MANLDPTLDPRVQDEGFKKRYAAETLRRPQERYRVACDMMGRRTQYDNDVACYASNCWENDLTVIIERKRLLNEYGEMAELPTKETVMKEVLELGRGTLNTVSDRLKAYVVYNEMMGYTGRGSNVSPSTTIFASKVMVVRDKGTDAEWEARLKIQQTKLIQDARDDRERNRTLQ